MIKIWYSKTSKIPRIGYFGNNFHFYFYNSDNKNDNGFRIKIRKRSDNIWIHHNFIFFRINRNKDSWQHRDRELKRRKIKVRIRNSLTIFEYSRWHSKGSLSKEHREGTKAYLRIKYQPAAKEIK